MRLLHILPTLDPAGGGPMEGVLQSGLACVAMGHRVEVLTLDDPAALYLGAFPLPVHAVGPARNGYGYSARYRPWLRAHARDYDAVVVNGLWQFHGLGAWLELRHQPVPYFVFTHGMLDPYFKAAQPLKHAKKWLYWPWAEYRLLRDARAVLFTCEEEKRLARQSFWLYKARERVVAFGTAAPPDNAEELRQVFWARHPELKNRRLLLFLGRLHHKKGCDLLIEAFARVASEHPDLHLLMAGPDQSGWQATLQVQAQNLGVADRITWPGMLQGALKWGAFHASAAYMLPSHQENFGIAVAEALGCGLPVLISNKVNIWREIEAAGAGLVDEDTVAGTERSLRRWLALNPQQRRAMHQKAVALFAGNFSVDAMARSLLDVTQEPAIAESRMGASSKRQSDESA